MLNLPMNIAFVFLSCSVAFCCMGPMYSEGALLCLVAGLLIVFCSSLVQRFRLWWRSRVLYPYSLHERFEEYQDLPDGKSPGEAFRDYMQDDDG